MQKIKISALAIAASLSFSSFASPIVTDIVTVVDESGSMSNEHSWLGGMISQLDNELLKAAGTDIFDPRYGLVGYGDVYGPNGQMGHVQYMENGELWGSASEFDKASEDLVTSGGTEDGYEALEFTIDNYDFRSSATKNIMLITDEDRDTNYTTAEFQDVLDKLNAHDLTLNVLVNAIYECGDGRSASGVDAAGNGYVITSDGYDVCENAHATYGSGSTILDYVDLALATGGSSWGVTDFRNGGAAFASMFSSTFIDVTREQIEENQVSVDEPGTFAIFSLAIAGFFARSFSRK